MSSAGEPLSARRGRRWWLVLGLAAFALVLAVGVISLWSYAGHDRPELIDDPVVVDAAERACAVMTQEVRRAAAAPDATGAALARAVRYQNDAVAGMMRTVNGLGAETLERDRPASGWLADWRSLVDERERYARDLVANRPVHFVVPAVDGRPITERMNDVGIACAVPGELLDLP